MTTRERLSTLFDDISQGRASEGAVLNELRSIQHEANDPYQRQKLTSAIEWAGIYFSPRKWQKWGSRETVRDHLLGDIYKARMGS